MDIVRLATGVRQNSLAAPWHIRVEELAPVHVMLAREEASHICGAMMAVIGGKPIIRANVDGQTWPGHTFINV